VYGSIERKDGALRAPRFGKNLKTLSIKKKIIVFFLIVGIVPAMLISLYYYFSSVSVLKTNIIQNRLVALHNILSRYDQDIDNLIEFTDWIFLDKDINYLLTNSLPSLPDYREKVVDVADNIANQVSFSQILPFISSIFVFGDNGLDLRYSNTGSGYVLQKSELLDKEWVQEGQSKIGTPFWASPIPPPHIQYEDEYLIPLVRNIIDIDTTKKLGVLIVLVNEKIFTDIYTDLSFNEDETLFFIYPSGIIVSCNDGSYIGKSSREVLFGEDGNQTTSPFLNHQNTKSTYLVASAESDKYGWRLTNFIPIVEIRNQQSRILVVAVLIFLLSLLLTVTLSAFLTRNISRPISSLIKKVEKFSKADFSFQSRKVGNNEIGLLEESINNMAVRIQRLMKDKIEREREKHNIELRMLQSQINPHFLYNTLNTIKWMAVLQRAEGIGNMISALSKILKYAVGKMSEKVLLREELEALDDYIDIQEMANKKKISFTKEIKDDSLLDCLVMKFILQPIIENSIIHGIKPKSSGGQIKLTVEEKKNKLRISVYDNGLGITRDKLAELNKDGHMPDTNSVGLVNIKRRIQLLYGKQHGLEVSSELGKYTNVCLSIPIETASD
jgi:two-component system sensor histidine kinase YesM